jgi:ABC-type lipoprotein release transport system permease subunit
MAAVTTAGHAEFATEITVRPSYLKTAVVMTIVGSFATIGPARRGLRIQPTEALRAE